MRWNCSLCNDREQILRWGARPREFGIDLATIATSGNIGQKWAPSGAMG